MRRVILVRPRAEGGLLAHVRDEARVLAQSGVHVVDAGEAPCFDDATSHSAGPAVEHRHLAIASGASPLAALRARANLRLILREEHRRAQGERLTVHAHGARAGALAALALMPGFRPRIRLVTTLHNRMPRAGLGAVIGRALFTLASRRSDLVLAVSPDLADAARASGARAVQRALIPAARPASVGSLRACDGDVLEVLCVARLAPQKDLACLCEAVRLVEEQYPGSLRVKVAGEGPERTRLEEFIEKYDLPVELLGRVEDTRALMRETHVVVQTSAWEGQPVAIQEAIGEGAAIIATDAGGTRWVTGERIPLVAPANARELAERLIAFVPGHPGSEERLGELRAASRARAAELPTEEDLIAQLESALFTFADDEENQRS